MEAVHTVWAAYVKLFPLLLRMGKWNHWKQRGRTGASIFKLITEEEARYCVLAVPCWAAETPHSSISQRLHLLFSVNVIWAKATGALCLRGLNLDSSTCLVWMDSLCWSCPQFRSPYRVPPPWARIPCSISPSAAAIFLPQVQEHCS